MATNSFRNGLFRVLVLLECAAGTLWRTSVVIAADSSYRYSTLDFSSHPLREYKGTVYNLSAAINWLKNAPPPVCPYPEESPLHRDWETKKARHDVDGLKWSRYVVNGSFIEKRKEGVIISVPVVKTVQTGTSYSSFDHTYFPVYRTINSTKEVLLKNAPDETFSLPVLAIPVGMGYIGSELIEAFDYGRPITNSPNATSPQAAPSVAAGTLVGVIEPGLSDLRGVSLTARVTESNNTWWRFAYKLTIRNNGTSAEEQSFKIQFLDVDGYVIDTGLTDRTAVRPGATQTITGDALIRLPGATRVKRLKAALP